MAKTLLYNNKLKMGVTSENEKFPLYNQGYPPFPETPYWIWDFYMWALRWAKCSKNYDKKIKKEEKPIINP